MSRVADGQCERIGFQQERKGWLKARSTLQPVQIVPCQVVADPISKVGNSICRGEVVAAAGIAVICLFQPAICDGLGRLLVLLELTEPVSEAVDLADTCRLSA